MQISKTYTEFLNSSGRFLQHLAVHFERLGVSEQQVLDYLERHDKFSIAYNKYIDPNQHNRAIVAEMSDLYKDCRREIGKLRRQIKNNAQITLTGDDYKRLGIRENKTTRTRMPKPTDAPEIVQTEIKPHENKFRLVTHDEAGEVTHRLSPNTELIIKTAYGSVAQPPKAADYNIVKTSRQARFSIVSPPEIPRTTIGFLKAAFVNSRGEIGPYCHPVLFVVN